MSAKLTVKDKTPELFQKLQAAISRFVRKAAGYIEGEIKSSMAEPKSGRSYPRGKDETHVASAPGESPAVDSSNLIGSIAPIFENSLEALVGAAVEYAQFLEFGTSQMAQRPVWEKTVEESLPTLEAFLASEIKAI